MAPNAKTIPIASVKDVAMLKKYANHVSL